MCVNGGNNNIMNYIINNIFIHTKIHTSAVDIRSEANQKAHEYIICIFFLKQNKLEIFVGGCCSTEIKASIL